MFKNTKNTVSQGSIGLAAAIFYYQRSGYNVLIPLVDNSDYDLVIEKDNCFLTVQVKTTKYKQNGNYVAQLKKVRSNRTTNKITVLAKCDLLFVLCEDGSQYSIPFDKLTSYNELRTSKFQQYKIT